MKPIKTAFHLLWLAILLATLSKAQGMTITPVAEGVARLHPELVRANSIAPNKLVRVIVLKTNTSDDAEFALQRLGGQVSQKLGIINAFAATISAGHLNELAASSGVRWISPDGPMARSGTLQAGSTASQVNYYLDTLGVQNVWAQGLRGRGIGVAVVDSGINTDSDLSSVTRLASFNANSRTINDVFGHGTHVAGIIAGNGSDSGGLYVGIAPDANLISLKISDETGMAYESDTVAALQWILENKDAYNIRVVNLSINSSTAQSYHTSPLDAAAEILWFNKIVVVASAGNAGTSTLNAAPANDPFIITVGASDERGTARPNDDIVAPYSAFSLTSDGFVKPEIVAPGTGVYSVLSKSSGWAAQYPERVALDGQYFRLSGTSMAAPMVAATAALLLQDEPHLTPDQVKFRLVATARIIGAKSGTRPYLNTYAAINGTTTQSANTYIPASQLLWTGTNPPVWGSVSWSSVSWSSVSWSSVSWSSVSWSSTYWDR
jgi:serine protease AprX